MTTVIRDSKATPTPASAPTLRTPVTKESSQILHPLSCDPTSKQNISPPIMLDGYEATTIMLSYSETRRFPCVSISIDDDHFQLDHGLTSVDEVTHMARYRLKNLIRAKRVVTVYWE